jgi:undecaprenyl-diphosphatase
MTGLGRSTDPRSPAPAAIASDVAASTVATAGRAVDEAARAAQRGAVPWWAALGRARQATAAAIAGLAGFGAVFAAVKARRSEAVDLAITLRLQRGRRPWLDRFMALVSWPGFPPQSRVIPPAAIGSLWLLRFRTEAAFETAAWGTALVSTGLKALMDRPRPVAGTDLRVVAAPLGGTSFPSGHVLTFVGVYGFLGWLAWTLVRDPLARALATGGALGLVVLVGPSRVYQGHHWPTDVTASYLLGTTYLIVVIAAYRQVKGAPPLGRPAGVAAALGLTDPRR